MSPPLPEYLLADGGVVMDIPANAVALEMAELCRALGYPGAEPPTAMAGLIAATSSEIRDLCDFRAGYALLPLAFDPSRTDGLMLGNRFFQTGETIGRQMQGAEQAALLICTVGPEPERRAGELLKNRETVPGYIADTVASILTEQLAETAHQHLEHKLAAEGFSSTNRFSPGYCGWDVREQHGLFSLLPKGFCGVFLEDSAFMQPRKSISAMIGIGKGLKRTEHPCKECNDRNCLYRQSKRVEHNNRKG